LPAPLRPPGVYDRTPAEAAEAAAVSSVLIAAMSRYGYQSVETPVIEYADLFLTKSGDEAINRLFTFEMYGRQLCLRSEFTASAARLYVERFQHEPKPLRWQFAGPVFRYESPGKGHSRQFTMLGTELIGATGAAADAETVGLAADGLSALGIRETTIYMGHLGLLNRALDHFDLDRRTKRFLLSQVENLRRPERGRAYVEKRFEQMVALSANAESLVAERAMLGENEASAEDIAHALELLLRSANLGTTGSGRTNEDVAQRLLTKSRRANQQVTIHRALDFLHSVVGIEGAPQAVFHELDALFPMDAAMRSLLDEWRETVTLLTEGYGLDAARFVLQPGLARGVNYYTGFVFEIHSGGEQLCGGGRYDDFIRVVGAAQDTPAVGFMYGLERVLDEARRAGFRAAPNAPQVLVVPIDSADSIYAVQVAARLRTACAVELYPPPTRKPTQAYTYAARRGITQIVVIGERERTAQTITVRDARSGAQTMLTLEALLASWKEPRP